ncbi:hypothetical protein PoB_000188900 [Plakobranchus ocellatus]|uniref:Uncharacterized protein n=1 Tax=Plakobranchus ocellatus TaxID=259542 RepID=A0AAV3Y076_9GAST|nr:hypothetical protein PoB_000188900 [Plakobranchus ocellatus]
MSKQRTSYLRGQSSPAPPSAIPSITIIPPDRTSPRPMYNYGVTDHSDGLSVNGGYRSVSPTLLSTEARELEAGRRYRDLNSRQKGLCKFHSGYASHCATDAPPLMAVYVVSHTLYRS